MIENEKNNFKAIYFSLPTTFRSSGTPDRFPWNPLHFPGENITKLYDLHFKMLQNILKDIDSFVSFFLLSLKA